MTQRSAYRGSQIQTEAIPVNGYSGGANEVNDGPSEAAEKRMRERNESSLRSDVNEYVVRFA